MNLENLVKAAIFNSIAIGLGFAFLFIPNVEFISVVVFISGLTLGTLFGLIVGGTSMLIYSGLNPLGSGFIFLPLFFSQIIAMAGIGLFGSLNRYLLAKLPIKILVPFTGVLGALSAIWYDLMTTIAYPISVGQNLNEIITFAISGLLFTTAHIISNSLIFSIVIPTYINRISS